MSTPVPPPFPAETTAPKYQPSATTPIPRLPKEGDGARAFGQGAVVTAILGVIFSAVKEMGGIPVTLAWLGKLSLSTWIVLSIILAIVSAFLYGRQVLGVMEGRMVQHDQQIVAGVNRIGLQQAMHGEAIAEMAADMGELKETVAEIAERLPPVPPSPSADTPIQRRSGAHEQVAVPESETPTGRYRRTGKWS